MTPLIQDCAIKTCPSRVEYTPSSDQNEAGLLQASIKISFNGISLESNSLDNSMTDSIFLALSSVRESCRLNEHEMAQEGLFCSLIAEFVPDCFCNPTESFLRKLLSN
jgi:hypothetical protein